MVKCNKIVGVVVAAHIGALGLGMAAPVFAQPALTADEQALGEAVRDRYDVALLSGGLALSPLDDVAGVRMIEVGESTIAIDGLLVTGQELRDRVGADADLIVRLTYLGPCDPARSVWRPRVTGCPDGRDHPRDAASATGRALTTARARDARC